MEKVNNMKKLKSSAKLMCKIDDHVDLFADSRQFILTVDKQIVGYYQNILQALYSLRSKKQLNGIGTIKNVDDLISTIEKSDKWLEEFADRFCKIPALKEDLLDILRDINEKK